jgi:hypothetical protein
MDIVSEHSSNPFASADLASFLLVRHSNVMEKLRAEIASTCGTSSELTRDDLRRMPYLQNVLKESMLHPFV